MFDADTYLRNLSEAELREIVLIPLLRKMGLRDVIEYHGGSAEKGKDIIGYYAGPLGDRHYVAVVAKKGDIHGAVSKKGNAREVLAQAEQALNEPYMDIYDLKEVAIHECWIATSGEIKNTAVDSIRGTLSKSNLDKQVRFIDRQRLIDLVNLHIPTFWHHERMALQFVHEMKSPLVAVRNTASYLKDRWRALPPEKVERLIGDIDIDVQAASHLLLNYSMLQERDLPLRKTVVRMPDIVSRAVNGFAPDDRGRIEVRSDLSGHDIPRLLGDSSRLTHAVRCVLDNAIRYSTEPVIVRLGLIGDGRGVFVRVSDQGMGVPPGAEGRIFEPGYRAQNVLPVSAIGLGMGLAVGRAILHQHDGELLLRRNAKPTEFEIQMPADVS